MVHALSAAHLAMRGLPPTVLASHNYARSLASVIAFEASDALSGMGEIIAGREILGTIFSLRYCYYSLNLFKFAEEGAGDKVVDIDLVPIEFASLKEWTSFLGKEGDTTAGAMLSNPHEWFTAFKERCIQALRITFPLLFTILSHSKVFKTQSS